MSTWKPYFGTNKEVFDKGLSAIREVLSITLKGKQTCRGRVSQKTTIRWTKIHIWPDTRIAIARLNHTPLEPGQWLARHIIERAQQLDEREVAVEIYCIPGHMCVKRNEQANKEAKTAAETRGVQECPE